MHLSPSLPRTTVAGAAAALLLTACGGGGDSSGSASSSSASGTTSSSSAEATGAASGSTFCTQAQALVTNLGAAATSTDPSTASQQFQQLADSVQAIDPPAQIAQDWSALADGLQQLARTAAQTDFTDPAQAQKFQQASASLATKLATPSQNVQKYLTEQCGIDTGGSSESATPTS